VIELAEINGIFDKLRYRGRCQFAHSKMVELVETIVKAL